MKTKALLYLFCAPPEQLTSKEKREVIEIFTEYVNGSVPQLDGSLAFAFVSELVGEIRRRKLMLAEAKKAPVRKNKK